jgi:DUF971 family protein
LKPVRFEVVGEYLAIRWDDGGESVISLQEMRRHCPCARCAGEVDVTGRVHTLGPPLPLTPPSFQPLAWEVVGNYAVQPRWADGHDTGIFTFELLRELGEASPG